MGWKPLSGTLVGRRGRTVTRMARRVPTERQVTGRVATAAVLVLALAYPFAGRAAEVVEPGATESSRTPTRTAPRSVPDVPVAASDDLSANPYAGIGNEELADVADRWDDLNQDERRWFFVEVRKRLIAGDGARTLPIGASARFGQVVRSPNGTAVRVETTRLAERTVDVRDDPRAYGLGFERRLEGRGGSAQPAEGRSAPTPARLRLPLREGQRVATPDGGS